MRILAGILLSIIVISGVADALSQDSFAGIKIGTSAPEALEILKGYESDAAQYDSEACYYLVPKDNKPGAAFMIVDGVVARIDIYSIESGITTNEGIGIGSKKSEVIAKYLDVKVSPHPYIDPDGEYLEVKLKNGYGIIFETEHDVVTSFRLGSYPAIEYIEGCL